MIPRYSLPEMAELFTDEARLRRVARGRDPRRRGVGQARRRPAGRRRARSASGHRFDVAAIDEREQVTDHDVAAFVDVVQERVGPPAGAWVHYGLTSSDVVDTALSRHQLTRACDLLLERVDDARGRRSRRGHASSATRRWSGARTASTPSRRRSARSSRSGRCRCAATASGCDGRAARDRRRQALRRGRHVLERRSRGRALRLRAARTARRCPRPRCSPATGTPRCSTRARRSARRSRAFALEIRHLQRTEVREVEEPFREGEQKGSSAMPHKRNPVKSEQLCGLARVLRGNLRPALEDVALWHERDISHSSVERIILPDSLMLAYYVLVQFATIVEGLRVHPERMLENLDASFGLVFSQPVLLALVEAGRTRDDAYRIVQRNAMRAWQEERPFRDVLAEDPEVHGVARRPRASTPASTSSARSPTSAARSTRSTHERRA